MEFVRFVGRRAKNNGWRGLRLGLWNAGLALSSTLVGAALAQPSSVDLRVALALVAVCAFALGLDSAHVARMADDVETMVRLGTIWVGTKEQADLDLPAEATVQASDPQQS
jgi:hypothetical protein